MATTSPDSLVKLEQLQYYDTKLKTYVDSRFTIKPVSSSSSDAVASYGLFIDDEEGTTQLGSTIDIPKDFFVRSAELKVAQSSDEATGIDEGDTYIDLVINTIDDGPSGKHVYINVSTLVPTTFVFATNDDMDAMFEEE